MLPEPIRVTLAVTDALDRLGVRYVLGGSLASAVHGVVRATMDADILAELKLADADALYTALSPTFYADAEAIRDAIAHGSSFNLIHLQSAFKIDIFVPRLRPFEESELVRGARHVVELPSGRTICVASREDTLLAKLEWYRSGGEVSERQWRDVLGIIRVVGDALDLDYARTWSRALGVEDLLDRALGQADDPRQNRDAIDTSGL